jgi:ferric-dicitrate binding protein FerR (iron transport regulator)
MNDKHDDNPNAQRGTGPDPLASLIRNAGRMPEPSAAFKEELRQELTGVWRQQVAARRRRRHWIGAGIAATLAIVAVGFQFLPVDPSEAGSIVRAPEGLQLTLPGERSRLAFAGERVLAGSRLATAGSPAAMEIGAGFNVRLDAHTRVTVNDGAHLALESGRLYIDSGVDSREDPGAALDGLVIDTPFGAVRDVGTQFVVALQPGQVTVQVREGLVKLEQEASAVAVAPGQRLHVDARGEMRTEQVALSGEDWSWAESVAPALVTEGRSLQAFLGAVRRQTGLEVRYASPELASKAAGTIIGGQHPDLPPRQLLDVVMAATSFRHIVTESEIIVSDAVSGT